MPLSWTDIHARAIAFSRDWQHAESEEADAKSFWDDFFEVFGVPRRRVASFEKRVHGIDGKLGRIDLLWKGVLLVEHKSRGKDLDRAFAQARDYFPGLKDRDLPRYILVSDFARFRLYDLETDEQTEFKLSQLKDRIKLFGFIAGYRVQEIKPQDPVNVKAAEKMGKLHDSLKEGGYTGHALEVLLVRVLFCLFADDTGLFQPAQSFRSLIEDGTTEDGADLGPKLAQLFQVLDTPLEKRAKALEVPYEPFPYVNGQLFEERLEMAAFDAAMRDTLLECCALDWSAISPAIFGALFQSIMNDEARRALGAHYTSEENILKVIKPLFLDELHAEFQRIKSNRPKLLQFHEKLRSLKFLDPACGCGNFLVISYRELRELELEVLRVVYKQDLASGQKHLDIHQQLTINVDQFHGIEIEEFPAQIAQVALWLVDHQMNRLVSDEFGDYYARIPFVTAPRIHFGNALRVDWSTIVSPAECSYILGNPPFVGARVMSDDQRADVTAVASHIRNSGNLDYVTAWYIRAAAFMQDTRIKCAFVSTSSISQGEQPGILWGWLFSHGARIHFAHRTFRWDNEARGVAAVHCVILGFALFEAERRRLFDYDDPRGEPHELAVANINPYLVDAPDVMLAKRTNPISDVPEIVFGSMPNDGGHLLLDDEERADLLANEPEAAPWIRTFMSADEFINGESRWCLWLVNIEPRQLRRLPLVAARVAAVKAHREASRRGVTRSLAAMPSLFGERRQPSTPYILIPRHSSERRRFIPMGFMDPSTICADSCLAVPDAKLWHFGVLSSTMHNAWIRATCGRLESRYRYSNSIVYNNFPWPPNPSEAAIAKIESAAQAVLVARSAHSTSSLADLYDSVAMPADLVKAHQALDIAVDAAYGRKAFASDAERVGFLFDLFQELTSLIPAPVARRRPRRPRHQP